MKGANHKPLNPFIPLNIAVLTVSDTRNESTDKSGHTLVSKLTHANHILVDKEIVKDDIYQLRSIVSQWIFNPQVNAILITGGTGFTQRDNTPQAVSPLLDKTIDGFGELFRQISYQDIGTSTIQSRAIAGIANKTLVVCMPGSPNACKTAWDKILEEQLDSRHLPCNFVGQLLVSESKPTVDPVSINCTSRT